MNKIVSLIVFMQVLSGLALAQLPKTVPLLPPRDSGSAAGVAFKNQPGLLHSRPQPHMMAAVQLGTLMRGDSTSSDVLGMQLFIGGRVSLSIPVLMPSFYLRPSLGYFRKQQSEGVVSVVQQVFEGGLTAQYSVINKKHFQWALGIANRFDYALSSINIYDQSNSGQDFRYRVGPSSVLLIKISNSLNWVSDFEFTFVVSGPTRSFGGLTTGLAFDL
ncbi:MAG: hypothetical protein EXR74_06675 [Bdellovibrionales bacterium]|nr:hypothetical protein [Bdellovibrionales bacterium]